MKTFFHKEVLDKSVVGNIKNILMSKTEGTELKTLEHENKKQGFSEIYGVIDKRKYIWEQETKIYQVEDVESDDAESVKNESSDICLSEEKKPVCEIAVEDYINYVMENRNEWINCFNKGEMKADVINFRLMATDTPILRNTLSMIGESEVALMLKIFGSSYSQGMVELDDIIIKNKNLFERMGAYWISVSNPVLAIFRSSNIFLVIYWQHHRRKRTYMSNSVQSMGNTITKSFAM